MCIIRCRTWKSNISSCKVKVGILGQDIRGILKWYKSWENKERGELQNGNIFLGLDEWVIVKGSQVYIPNNEALKSEML